LKIPKTNPKDLSIEPIPVHVTALLKDLATTIVKNREKINIKAPRPTLLMNSDSIYSETQGCIFGTNIMVITRDKIHFINDIKLSENPFKKH
tara:strand:- start:809 stop:1084 length:276 start_codon:yes stop_codon:yes gene_type:complete